MLSFARIRDEFGHAAASGVALLIDRLIEFANNHSGPADLWDLAHKGLPCCLS